MSKKQQKQMNYMMKTWKFDEPIKNLEILLAKKQCRAQLCRTNRADRGNKRKDKLIESR